MSFRGVKRKSFGGEFLSAERVRKLLDYDPVTREKHGLPGYKG